MALLEVRGITKTFAQKKKPPYIVLENMSFTVEQGQYVSLLGPSGCGKTTLLSILGGFLPVDAGVIILSGQQVTQPGPDRGFVFQNYALFPWMTVKENILYPLKVRKFTRQEQKQRLQELLDMSHLHGSENKYPIQLSGGMQQRVAVVRALASRPEVLLLDEPLGAIDFQMRELLQEELAALVKGAKTTVVMVTHDVNESIYLSDRVIVMSANKGLIVKDVYVDLDRPRDRSSEAFKAYASQLTDLVRQAFHEKNNGFELPAGFSGKDDTYERQNRFTDAYNRMNNRYTKVDNDRIAQ
ncbi:MAG: ABC transporter ATP-binding protein SaoA [Syntrophomonadaceae bacterium]|jgi:NitT/TauT family transport system ATP-binding protein